MVRVLVAQADPMRSLMDKSIGESLRSCPVQSGTVDANGPFASVLGFCPEDPPQPCTPSKSVGFYLKPIQLLSQLRDD